MGLNKDKDTIKFMIAITLSSYFLRFWQKEKPFNNGMYHKQDRTHPCNKPYECSIGVLDHDRHNFCKQNRESLKILL